MVTRKEDREAHAARSQQFLSTLRTPPDSDLLFEHLPDVYFFVKDASGRFMRVNRAFLELVRATSEESVVGRRDSDMFPSALAESYTRDDREVLRTSRPIIDQAELVKNADGSVDWFITTKLPLLDKAGRAIGVCGFTRDVKKMNLGNAQLLSWAPALEFIVNNYASHLEVPALARRLHLSVSQFNRQFRKRFHTTPKAYQKRVRLSAATELLVATSLPIAEIAQRTGFCDQSHFANDFVASRGVPPSEYRALHSKSGLATGIAGASEPPSARRRA